MRGSLTLAFVAAALLALGSGDAVTAERLPSFTIGYAAGLLADPFQAIQADLTIAAAKKAGLRMLPVADANGNPAKQVADVRKLIAQGAKGVIAVPIDGNAIVPALDAAAASDVPVVAIDTAPASGKVAMIVRADDRRMAEDACHLIGKQIGGHGSVLSLLGNQATSASRDRSAGFADCVRRDYPEIALIERQTDGKPDRTASVVRDAVTAMPDVAAIYLESDAIMLAGALSALRSVSRLTPVGAPHHIMLVSIDGTPLALQRIRAGHLDAAISEPLDQYVTYGLRYLEAAMKGERFDPGPTDHDSRIVYDEGNPMDLLAAPIVTRANASSPALWGNKIKT